MRCSHAICTVPIYCRRFTKKPVTAVLQAANGGYVSAWPCAINPSTFQISITTKPTSEKAKMLMTNKATPYRPMVL